MTTTKARIQALYERYLEPPTYHFTSAPTLREAMEVELQRLEAFGRGAREVWIGVGGFTYIDDPEWHICTVVSGNHRWCDIAAEAQNLAKELDISVCVNMFERRTSPARGVLRFHNRNEPVYDIDMPLHKQQEDYEESEKSGAGRGMPIR